MRNVALVFALLFLVIIGNAIFFGMMSAQEEQQRIIEQLDIKSRSTATVQNNELEKLNIISSIVINQRARFNQFLDYDNVTAIQHMLKSIVSLHDIDLAVIFDEDGRLLTTYPGGVRKDKEAVYSNLLLDTGAGVGLCQVKPEVLIDQVLWNQGFASRPDPLDSLNSRLDSMYLAYKSVIHQISDTGDIYAYIVLFKFINGNEKLAQQMAAMTGAEVIFYDRNKNIILTSFNRKDVGFPKGDMIRPNYNDTYFIKLTPLFDFSNTVIGHVAVAVDRKPFEENWYKLIINNIIPFFISLFISLFLFLLLKFKVFNRIRLLVGGLHRVTEEEGNLSIRLPIPEKSRENVSRDEVEQLLFDFNQMMDKLEGANDKLNYEMQERKQAAKALQQAQKMETVGLLAGGVAHDLNNILSGIVSYPELILLKLPPDSPLREDVQLIKESGKRAAVVVQDLLTLSRRGVSVNEIIDLNLLINEQISSPEYRDLLSNYPKTQLIRELDPHLLPIKGSPSHLSKTIMNLINNGMESMPKGGQLSISTENRYVDTPIRGYDTVNEGEYVVLTINDSGIGIDERDLDRIFEPFYTKKVMGRSGTGLGMAVVWGTVKDLKGYIEVESQQGQGTSFTLYFPATREKTTIKKAEIEIDQLVGNGESVLVVDDIVEQCEIAARIFSKLGYQVTTICSGEEAVEYLKENSVDLVVLDMIMEPGIDGLETYKRILAIRPGQKAIIASGYSETDRVKETLQLGAYAYVKKPFLLSEIGKAVKQALQ